MDVGSVENANLNTLIRYLIKDMEGQQILFIVKSISFGLTLEG